MHVARTHGRTHTPTNARAFVHAGTCAHIYGDARWLGQPHNPTTPPLLHPPGCRQVMSLPWKGHIVGVGLDSTELGNPPSKFEGVFDTAISLVCATAFMQARARACMRMHVCVLCSCFLCACAHPGLKVHAAALQAFQAHASAMRV